jgi:hypothetical protein
MGVLGAEVAMLWRFMLTNLLANGSPLGMASERAAQALEAVARRAADKAAGKDR